MRLRYLLIILFVILIFACDKGLSPDLAKEKTGFGGTITFIGEWNNKVKRTHVVLFKDPLLSVLDFNVFNLKYVSDTIPYGSQSYNYSTNDISLISNIEQIEYAYLAVAQSEKDSLSLNREDWFVVGVYNNNNSQQPEKLNIDNGNFLENINILCDLNNPPPQPPGGISQLSIIKKIRDFITNQKKVN